MQARRVGEGEGRGGMLQLRPTARVGARERGDVDQTCSRSCSCSGGMGQQARNRAPMCTHVHGCWCCMSARHGYVASSASTLARLPAATHCLGGPPRSCQCLGVHPAA